MQLLNLLVSVIEHCYQHSDDDDTCCWAVSVKLTASIKTANVILPIFIFTLV
jgi:hypothetical protein